MTEGESSISWAWRCGALALAGAWLAGALAPLLRHIWGWPVLLCLGCASLCWGYAGWRRARARGQTYEESAFSFAILAIVPWMIFLVLMFLPYALGVRQ
jgi:hypothetical protein